MVFSLIVSILLNTGPAPVITNYHDALALANEEDKNILMIFAGSDWCRPCKRFKSSILESDQFINWAQQEMVLLYLDFPLKRKLSEEVRQQNDMLAKKFNSSGVFPQLVLIDKDEEVIRSIHFNDESIDEFIALLGRKSIENSYSTVE